MSPNDFFHWAGEQLGWLIREIVAGLAWFFGHIGGALDSFYDGLAAQLGIGHSLFALLILVIGLLMLLSALRSLLAGRIISSLIVGGLGVLILVWLIG